MIPLLLALWVSAPAQALTMPQSGPYLEAHAGLGLGDAPLHAGLGWEAAFGWWAGRYDDAYAIGRYWSVGATLRQDWIRGAIRSEPMLELRHGIDLIVVGWFPFVAGGPVFDETELVGGTARLGFGFEFRRTRYLGLTLRLVGGADFGGGDVGGAGAALLGFQFSKPGKSPQH